MVDESKPSEIEVLDALQRLLVWPEFARSKQLSRFLEYIVHAGLRGDAGSIKAYSIAVDVFGRPPDFDPQSDPIVRVQARRLRGLLQQYYEGPGQVEAVRIGLPTGRYVPEFSLVDVGKTAESPAAEATRVPPGLAELKRRGADGPRRVEMLRSWLILAFATFCLGVISVAVSNRGAEEERQRQSQYLLNPPTVTVMEFDRLSTDVSDIGLAAGLSVELVRRLNSFGTIDARYGGTLEDAVPRAQKVDFVVSGIVRRTEGEVLYSAILTNVRRNEVVWSEAIGPSDGVIGTSVVDEVATRFASALGSISGPVHAPGRKELEEGRLQIIPSVYLCRLLFALNRERATDATAARTERCFSQLSPRAKEEGTSLAAMGSLIVEGAQGTGYETAPVEQRIEAAAPLFRQAVRVAPLNAFVWVQLARYQQIQGLHDAAQASYSTSLKLNPADTDTMAARARHLIFIGRSVEGTALARAALASSISPPPWYHVGPALAAIEAGEFAQAREMVDMAMLADAELGPIIAVMVGRGLGDEAMVNRYLPEVLSNGDFKAEGIIPRLKRRISDEALIRLLSEALSGAGVTPQALNGG